MTGKKRVDYGGGKDSLDTSVRYSYNRINKYILEQLDEGVCPWKKPWNQDFGKARNFVSQRVYSGYNRFVLEFAGLKHKTNEWLTIKQCNHKHSKINKGAKGIPVFYYEWMEKETDDTNEKADTKRKPFLKVYTVFNVDQSNLDYEPPALKQKQFTPIENAEKIVDGYTDQPAIFNNAQKAFYDLKEDAVYLPDKRLFNSNHDYYATLFHELSHSTGSQSRLNRNLENIKARGDDNYSKEELIAELTSSYLCGESGLDTAGKLEQADSYIDDWSSTLRKHPYWFVNACNAAQKSSDYILNPKHGDKEKGR